MISNCGKSGTEEVVIACPVLFIEYIDQYLQRLIYILIYF